jgi:outer membrane protein assembly factor BamB
MKRLFILLFAALFACSAYATDWPMFRFDLTHSSFTPDAGPLANALNWSYTTGSSVLSSPAVADGIVYVGSMDTNVYALNVTDGTLVWSYATGDVIDSSPAVAGGIVYIGSWDGKVYALNATDGTLVWNYTTGGFVESSPAVADGIVYVGTRWDNKIYALNATDGTLVWNYTTGNNVESSPAVVDGIVYFGCWDSKVYALNATDGALIWNYLTGGTVWSSPAVVDGIVYVGSEDRKVYALNATDGTLVWNYTTGDSVFPSPAVANGIVYAGSWDNKVYALNATDGTLVWNYTAGGWVESSPAVADGIVYVGSSDAKVHALNATTGTQAWSYATGGRVWSSPAVVDGIVYVGSDDGNVYAIGGPDVLTPYVSEVSLMAATQDDSTGFWVTATDNMGVTHCDFYWNGANVSSMSLADGDSTNGLWVVNYTPAGLGNFTAWANCSDAAGYSNKTDITVSVDTGPKTLWYRTRGTNGEEGRDVATDSSGNVYFAGLTANFGAGSNDAFLEKYDSSGNLLLNTTWGYAGDDSANGVITDPSGNVYITGYTTSFEPYGDAFLVKYDPSFNQLWNRTWGGEISDGGEGVTTDSSGNVYISGVTLSFSPGGGSDAFLVKYDSSGNQQWNATWGGAGDDEGNDVKVDSSGNVYMVGTAYSFTSGAAFLVKYDSAGNYQWNRTWGGPAEDGCRGIALDSSGNIYIVGYTASFGAGSYDAFIAEYDSDGTQLWNTTWGGANYDIASGADFDSSGNLYLVGTSYSFGPPGVGAAFLVEYNSSGDQQGYRVWALPVGVNGRSMAVDQSDNVYIAGYITTFDLGGAGYLVKFRGSTPAGNVTGGVGVGIATAPEADFTLLLIIFGAAVLLSAAIYSKK